MKLSKTPNTWGELKMKTRAIVLHQNGDADQMVWEDVDLPNPTDSQVLVKHEFVGFNMVDTYHRSGIYPTPPKPCRLEIGRAHV